jgi:hypothetical protein
MKLTDLRDVGFADIRGADLILRQLKMRSALKDARDSIQVLLDTLDHRAETDGNAVASLFDESGDLVPDALERVQRDPAVKLIAGNDVREKELLQGVNVVLQFLDTVGIGLRHGLFSRYGGAETIGDDDRAHRLCGGAK